MKNCLNFRGYFKTVNVSENSNKQSGISSVYLAGEILSVLMKSETPLSLSEISKACSQPVARLYPYLFELHKAGMISRNPLTLDYTLGSLCMRLGLKVLGKDKLVQALRTKLPHYASLYGVNLFLTVIGPSGPVVVANYEYAKTLNTALTAGSSLSFFTTATGAVLWAFLSHTKRQDFLKQETVRNESSVYFASPKQERCTSFEEIVQKGYSYFRQTPMSQIDSLSFPFFNENGEITAAVTLTMQSGDINEQSAVQWLNALKEEVHGC